MKYYISWWTLNMIAKTTINTLVSHKKGIQTITNNNGKEFVRHKKIAKKLEYDVYFAHPYSSWKCGLNEYTNKLIRQYFPKNQSLDTIKESVIFETVNKSKNSTWSLNP